MFGFLSRKLTSKALQTTSGTSVAASPQPEPPASLSPPSTPQPQPQPQTQQEPLSELQTDFQTQPELQSPLETEPYSGGVVMDPKALHTLIASIPPQTLHDYTLAHLIPPTQPLSPLSFPNIPLPSISPNPQTLTILTDFFKNLIPPPRLHCVRCHKDYFEVENGDRSCLVAHDDESAEVERVGATTNRGKGIGTEYETLWGCCGKTVEGDGDMGPPDGWCYEGKHTTDLKRARFRADSSLQDDKLLSCRRMRCDQIKSTSPRSTRGGNKRRRTLMEEAEVDEESTKSSIDDSFLDDNDPVPVRKVKRTRHSKSVSISSKADNGKPTSKGKKVNEDMDVEMRVVEDGTIAMDVDSSIPNNESKTQSETHFQTPATPKSPPSRTTSTRKPRRKSSGTTTGTATGSASKLPTTPGTRAKPKPKAKSPLASSFTPKPAQNEGNVSDMGNLVEQPTVNTPSSVQLPLPRAIVEITTAPDGSPRLGASRDLRQKSSSRSVSVVEGPDDRERERVEEAQQLDHDKEKEKEKERPKPKPRARRNTVSAPKTPKKSDSIITNTTNTNTNTTTPKSMAKPKSLVKSKPSSSTLKGKSLAETAISSSTAAVTTTPQKRRQKAKVIDNASHVDDDL